MNALTFRALRMLAHGDFRSGEAMARALGVSRASIWNALQALDEIGIEVFRVRGRGYRLSEPLTLLDPQAIELALGCVASYFNLEVLDRVDSTNTLLMQRAAAGTASGTVVAAEWQTQGRGRRGREWHALPGATLTFSLLWRFAQGAGFLAGLSLAGGTCDRTRARALRRSGRRTQMAERCHMAGPQARRRASSRCTATCSVRVPPSLASASTAACRAACSAVSINRSSISPPQLKPT
jgi:biotin operon repressor BirA-like protein